MTDGRPVRSSLVNEEVPMPVNELESFLETWDREAENTLKLLKALPMTQ